MTQLKLPYAPFDVAQARADFCVSPCNAEASQWIDRWPDWPSPAVLLCGPEGCGKTHLAQIWQARAGAALVAGAGLGEAAVAGLAAAPAIAVDDADRAPERALLHLYNACRERRRPVLLTARRAPAEWPVALPDLASRLRAIVAVRIAPPDDALLAALLVKHFSDRQLQVRREVIDLLVPRMERSFAAAAALVTRLDAEGGRIDLALARRVVAAAGQPSPASRPPGEA